MSIPQPKSMRGDRRGISRRGSASSKNAPRNSTAGCPEPVRATLAGGRWLRFDPPTQPHHDCVVAAEPKSAEPKSAEQSRSDTCAPRIDETIDFQEVSNENNRTAQDPHKWLALHATDLIDRLAGWSDDLSVREENLRAREARWEREARRLRMEFQQTQMEFDEIAADLNLRTRRLVDQQAKMHRDIQALAMVVW